MNDDLLDVAFGSNPGGRPPRTHAGTPVTPCDHWLRAVGLGARGRYAAARAELDRVRRGTDDPPLRSLASSTLASHLRQSGHHAAARRHDGEALRLATGVSGAMGRAAALDSLIGLAADSLGTSHLRLAERLLDRAAADLERLDDDAPWIWSGRVRLRLLWVRAESALYRGDAAAAHAHLAARGETLDGCPSLRHRLKTDLIAAAASAAVGEVTVAAASAAACIRTARSLGQLPLEWAATALLLGTDPSAHPDGPDVAAGDEARLRAELNARGGTFVGR